MYGMCLRTLAGWEQNHPNVLKEKACPTFDSLVQEADVDLNQFKMIHSVTVYKYANFAPGFI